MLHCNKIKFDWFVFNVLNVLNGEVPLSYPNEELKTLEDTRCVMYCVTWMRVQMFKHGECLVPKIDQGFMGDSMDNYSNHNSASNNETTSW